MTHLKEGDKAPEFSFTDHLGESKSLTQFQGKKVILYFYPKDNTPGCTAEACNLRDNYQELKDQGYEVIGVSADSEKSHTNFRTKHELPFYLVSDTDKELPVCFDCHSAHEIRRADTEGFKLEIMSQCGRCHEQIAEN